MTPIHGIAIHQYRQTPGMPAITCQRSGVWNTVVRLSVACVLAAGLGNTWALSPSASGTDIAFPDEDAMSPEGRPAAPPLAVEFSRDASPRLAIRDDEVIAYAARLNAALPVGQAGEATARFVVLVDRHPDVQAALLFWGSSATTWALVGAVPVSTGLPGRYQHFKTPLGVFDHALTNPDYRAEGTRNTLGFRGYGVKGMRVYDFGWIAAPRGWGDGAMGKLRLQMHATDPALAEHLLGTPRSEGCVRIPSSFNTFLDRHALLDEDYERAVAEGETLWVLRKDREPTATPGHLLVVVESDRVARPSWSPKPASPSSGPPANMTQEARVAAQRHQP